jgi:hypothetical protein
MASPLIGVEDLQRRVATERDARLIWQETGTPISTHKAGYKSTPENLGMKNYL